MEKYIETTMENLERNNIKPFYVEKREEVVPLIKTLLKKGESISCGGSVTLHECEVDTKILKSGDYDFIDRSGLQGEELREAYGKAFMCDTFFTSSNAVTERGELYNVDGNSNRVACIVYGPRQVLWLSAKTKSCRISMPLSKELKNLLHRRTPPAFRATLRVRSSANVFRFQTKTHLSATAVTASQEFAVIM